MEKAFFSLTVVSGGIVRTIRAILVADLRKYESLIVQDLAVVGQFVPQAVPVSVHQVGAGVVVDPPQLLAPLWVP